MKLRTYSFPLYIACVYPTSLNLPTQFNMRIQINYWFILLILAWIQSNHFSVSISKCQNHQKYLLLQLKNTLQFNHSLSTKLARWDENTNCCEWDGVQCDPFTSQVIGLDLCDEPITGGMDNSSTLFQLQYLQTLNLTCDDTVLTLSQSIGNLKRLRNVNISGCFHGIIPSALVSLPQLEVLDLSNNTFTGSIPSFPLVNKLTQLVLRGNNLSGSITTIEWGNLLNLTTLDLSANSLNGMIPTSLFSLPSLTELWLQENHFSGLLNNITDISSSPLVCLDLSDNTLEGSIPPFIFQLRLLWYLDLSCNEFNGTVNLNNILSSLVDLEKIYLSHNCLTIITSGYNTNLSFPKLSELGLANCNLHVLPEFLKKQSSLYSLDLSYNYFRGKIPTWIWRLNLKHLDLSYNHLTGFEQPIPSTPNLNYLYLHSNNFQGHLPSISSSSLWILDCSNNKFTSINPDIDQSLPSLEVLYLFRNRITGTIPSSLCMIYSLKILDLAYNHLNGTIPECLIRKTGTLISLHLKENNLVGTIPEEFGIGCMLQSFEVNMNFLDGHIPRSLVNCEKLQVLDLGNNKLADGFPCHLKSLSSLQVMVLRANELSGTIICSNSNSIWPSLQILDLASNHFNGTLSTLFSSKWEKMMTISNEFQSGKVSYVEIDAVVSSYDDQVAVTFKGSEHILVKILTIFTSIDLSMNYFHGEVPKELGNLIGLKALNISHNFLSGNIPTLIGNLSQLESLDLSCNSLSGNIPQELANLNFLEALNLSFNKLVGTIPTSTQLQSFNASSYQGNSGLRGPPLTPRRRHSYAPNMLQSPPPHNEHSKKLKDEVEWMIEGVVVGFPVGLTLFVGPLLYIKRWRSWYSYHIDKQLTKVIQREGHRKQGKRGKVSRKHRQRR